MYAKSYKFPFPPPPSCNAYRVEYHRCTLLVPYRNIRQGLQIMLWTKPLRARGARLMQRIKDGIRRIQKPWEICIN